MNRVRCINPLTLQGAELTVAADKDNHNRLGYTPAEIAALPTVTQVVAFLKRMETLHLGHKCEPLILDYSGRPVAPGALTSAVRACHSPEAPDGAFVCNHLQSGRYSLKPNLTRRPWLYRGQNEVFPSVASSFSLLERRGQRIEANVRFADFFMLLSSHPLFRLFDSGIMLPGADGPVFFEMNYYGLGQHYGIRTDLLDFSSDVEVAAFFATTKWLAPHAYEPVECTPGSYGVMYAVDIDEDTTFCRQGFTTIGLQVYPRTGAQKGFCHSWDQAIPQFADINRNAAMVAFPFRHDAAANDEIYRRWQGGALLFPADELQPLAEEIRLSGEVSLDAFAYNLYANPLDNEVDNRRDLQAEGVTVNPHLRRQFTPATLTGYYADIRNGWWEHFCSQIYFGTSEAERSMAKAMRALPSDPHYAHYFDPTAWPLLNYHRNLLLSKQPHR